MNIDFCKKVASFVARLNNLYAISQNILVQTKNVIKYYFAVSNL